MDKRTAEVVAKLTVDADAGSEWAKRNLAALAVWCPSCKAGANEACKWGSTHSLGATHQPRKTLLAKKLASA